LTREESAALLGSFRTWRDRAIAGLMLLSGMRSAEVLGLMVADVDIVRRWVRVIGKGDKERRVPIDLDVAGAIQTYLLVERPETEITMLFDNQDWAARGFCAAGPTRGGRLSR
jgi:site-specific recombinase XerC